MNKKIAVLGAGMVGRAIAADLSKKHSVTCVDNNTTSLLKAIQETKGEIDIVQADLTNYHTGYANLLADFDFVVSALPGFMGFNALKDIILAKKNVVDISFFPENSLLLDDLAKENGVTAIVDAGVAPGMNNLILGRYNNQLLIEDFKCVVGGLPKKRTYPFEYKAPFSPIDVLEEYTRPARYVENGHIVTKPALSDSELIDFEEVGTLEAFNTDGLRSMLFTMTDIPNMIEKTLRYPGHIDFIKKLIAAGFLDKTNIDVRGQQISPLDFTSRLIFDNWKLEDGEEEFTIMNIKIATPDETIEYHLYDEYDDKTQTSSMSRTTGYTCNAALHLLIEGLFTNAGLFPLELIGPYVPCFDYMLEYLRERNVIYKKTTIPKC